MKTPHINAEIGDFAKTVLMPGDPLRSKFIAENFLENSVLVNNIRGIQGYTGTYKGNRISVMASGMGMPSIGIYSYELYKFYNVENIIRIGTAGGLSDNLKLRDIIFAIAANTNSNYGSQYDLKGTIAPSCSYELLSEAEKTAKEHGVRPFIGNVFTSDTFYNADCNFHNKLKNTGSLAIEMETAALYLNAMQLNKNALAILTVSDLPLTGDSLDANERETSFTQMIELALETSLKLE